MKIIYGNSKQYNVEKDYKQKGYFYGGQLEGQPQLSNSEETEQLTLEVSHLVVVWDDVFDYKHEGVVEEGTGLCIIGGSQITGILTIVDRDTQEEEGPLE